MDSQAREKALLRNEVIKAWKVVGALVAVLREYAKIANAEIDGLREELAEERRTSADLREQLNQAQRQLAVHESWNHSSREAVLFAKMRKEFQRMADAVVGAVAGAVAAVGAVEEAGAGVDGTDGMEKPAGRSPGHQRGVKGVSHGYKPTYTRVCIAATCGNCGRGDVQHEKPIQKLVIDVTKCGEMVCHMEEITAAYCSVCRVVTYPATDSVPGSSFGPDLRRLTINMHKVMPSVRSIQYILESNHGVIVSIGSISNCLSGVVGSAENGGRPRTVDPEPEDELPSVVSGAPFVPPADHGPYDAGLDTVWSGLGIPPLLAQIEEKTSMAPNVQVDESRENVEGEPAQALVLDTPDTVLIRIEPDKSKETMENVFWMARYRPFGADMYRGGNAFHGDFQSCFVHVNRKSEALAIRHGVGSFEYTLYVMMRGIYHDAKAVAETALEMAGGPVRSACDIGTAVRTVPGLAGYIESNQAALLERVGMVSHAYRNGDVSDDESRKFADTLENAMPYLFTFLGHPGMKGSTNNCEGIIRRYVVRVRNIQRILPNWRAARNLAVLQTLHATCAKRGIFSGDVVAAGISWNMFGSGIPPPIFQNLR